MCQLPDAAIACGHHRCRYVPDHALSRLLSVSWNNVYVQRPIKVAAALELEGHAALTTFASGLATDVRSNAIEIASNKCRQNSIDLQNAGGDHCMQNDSTKPHCFIAQTGCTQLLYLTAINACLILFPIRAGLCTPLSLGHGRRPPDLGVP